MSDKIDKGTLIPITSNSVGQDEEPLDRAVKKALHVLRTRKINAFALAVLEGTTEEQLFVIGKSEGVHGLMVIGMIEEMKHGYLCSADGTDDVDEADE